MNQTYSQSRFSLPVRLVIGILVILALSLWAFYILMNPPMTDMGLMAVFLTITAVISALAALPVGIMLGVYIAIRDTMKWWKDKT